MTGKFSRLLDCYPVIDILPYILLDNAVKYSPAYGSIDIEFSDGSDFLHISISSIGPLIEEHELINIFQNGFRSINAIASNVQGSCRGLAIAKHICDIHDIEIEIKVGENIIQYEGVNYSNFDVHLMIPLH